MVWCVESPPEKEGLPRLEVSAHEALVVDAPILPVRPLRALHPRRNQAIDVPVVDRLLAHRADPVLGSTCHRDDRRPWPRDLVDFQGQVQLRTDEDRGAFQILL